MNKIYKSIYNAVRGVWVVVSEATSSYKQPSKSLLGGGEVLILPTSVKERAIKIAAITACLMLMGDSAWNFTQNGTALLTTWDTHLLIEWDSYLRHQPLVAYHALIV